MLIEREIGDESLAKVYVGNIDGHLVEFAESVQPPLPREKKWVLIISCLIGCPVRCLMCDAGRQFRGLLTKEQMMEQIDFMVRRRYPEGILPMEKFKIQFTRMGEPSFNPAVLDVLEELPRRYRAPGLLCALSTVGPKHRESFFARLTEVKNRLYPKGRFQMQFSIHTTDEKKRDALIPTPKMSLKDIAHFGEDFFQEGDRKITLNFIAMHGYSIDANVLRRTFDPSRFMIKLTPLNPTRTAKKNLLKTLLDPEDGNSVNALVQELQSFGFETLVSIGALEENAIGSNCGQYVSG